MISVDLSPRKDAPDWLAYGTPVITIVAALAVSSVALVALSVNPLVAYTEMFIGTLSGLDGVAEVLLKAIPLTLTGLAVYLPYRANLWNIGAEGQLYVGAIIGIFVGVNANASLPGLVVLVVLAGGLAGAVYGGIAGFLRARWGVNEILVTLMLTFVATRLTDYLVQGPMQGNAGALSGSAMLPSSARIPQLAGTRLHAGIFLALLATVLIWLFVSRTVYGYEITMTGSNPDATEQAGISRGVLYILVFAIGGALAGLGGAMEMAGVQGRLRSTFSPGYGFTAIPIALLGRNGAFQVLLAALFFAVLFVGGQNVVVSQNVPSSIVEIIQSLVILFLITAEFFKRFEVDVSLGTTAQIDATPDRVGDR